MMSLLVAHDAMQKCFTKIHPSPQDPHLFPELFATDAADDDMKLPVSKYQHHQQQQTPPN
jgi:hypothetical protein